MRPTYTTILISSLTPPHTLRPDSCPPLTLIPFPSTLAGEVHKPRKTFPRALYAAVVLVVLSYIIPLLAGTGAIPFSADAWDDGYFAEVGQVIGGNWLFWWIAAAAASSNMGLFEAEMSRWGEVNSTPVNCSQLQSTVVNTIVRLLGSLSCCHLALRSSLPFPRGSDSFQLLGMAERGMLPEAFAYRSKHGTPLLGIICSASGVLMLSWMSFQEVPSPPAAPVLLPPPPSLPPPPFPTHTPPSHPPLLLPLIPPCVSDCGVHELPLLLWHDARVWGIHLAQDQAAQSGATLQVSPTPVPNLIRVWSPTGSHAVCAPASYKVTLCHSLGPVSIN